jgi:hypothetical protein
MLNKSQRPAQIALMRGILLAVTAAVGGLPIIAVAQQGAPSSGFDLGFLFPWIIIGSIIAWGFRSIVHSNREAHQRFLNIRTNPGSIPACASGVWPGAGEDSLPSV